MMTDSRSFLPRILGNLLGDISNHFVGVGGATVRIVLNSNAMAPCDSATQAIILAGVLPALEIGNQR